MGKARDLRRYLTCFARVKCGSIMSGFGKRFDCRQCHLLCDLPKVLTDKSQVGAVENTLCQA